MKTIVVFLRILIVGLLWGIVFTEGIRVIMLCNWRFDIFWPDHWQQLIKLWKAGWVVRAPKEWALVLLIITFIPMLITGWWTLSLVAWEKIIWQIITLPVTLYRRFIKQPINVISTNNRYGVTKRKSYKQIRPAGVNTINAPISDYGTTPVSAYTAATPYTPSTQTYSAATPSPYALSTAKPTTAAPAKKTDVAATIDHALFKFDDDDDDFDLDIDSFEKTDIKKNKNENSAKAKPKYSFDDEEENETPKRSSKRSYDDDDDFEDNKTNRNKKRADDDRDNKRNSRNSERDDEVRSKRDKNKRENRSENEEKSGQQNIATNHGPVYDALQQKNYDIISGVNINGTIIDFIGVSENDICLCLVDKEAGDWLADEEMFNGEEPLWFSENSHRISPVCKLSNARKIIREKLEEEQIEQNLQAFVVIQMANIINADDMFEVWEDMNIEVTRINRGAPKEIRLFSKTLSEAENKINKKELDRLRKIFKNI